MQDSDYESILHHWLGMVTSSELAEMDGFICGLVARQGSPEQLHALLFTEDSATDERLQECTIAMNLRHQQLATFGNLFEPLVEDDDSPVAVQTESLAIWCYGFLATLGDEQELRERLSDEGYESLQDLQSISQVAVDDISDNEETAYVEVFEYVRVAASLVFTDLAAPSAEPTDQFLH
ncbi:MAG: UPF0149 family protein [Rhodobacteraceae bacterium]|nr:UPF0149 family protein [Paracoccaceae bacterium]